MHDLTDSDLYNQYWPNSVLIQMVELEAFESLWNILCYKAPFQAYQESEKIGKSGVLEKSELLNGFSNKQLFFLAYAQVRTLLLTYRLNWPDTFFTLNFIEKLLTNFLKIKTLFEAYN